MKWILYSVTAIVSSLVIREQACKDHRNGKNEQRDNRSGSRRQAAQLPENMHTESKKLRKERQDPRQYGALLPGNGEQEQHKPKELPLERQHEMQSVERRTKEKD